VSTVNHSASPLARELVAAFGAFGPAYMKWVAATAKHSGVTWARMKTLRALECNGPQIMTSLRDELGVTARSVTALVDALEDDALVRRVPHPTDRRATIVELTDEGRRTISGQFEAHAIRAAQVFCGLDESDQRELLRLLRLLSARLAELHAEERSLSGR
jgi:DNA-binding MarR family transcriptional regulator